METRYEEPRRWLQGSRAEGLEGRAECERPSPSCLRASFCFSLVVPFPRPHAAPTHSSFPSVATMAEESVEGEAESDVGGDNSSQTPR
jgi:hypothetical protein